jgi:DNA-binding CsgD family transcriptional regulator
MRVGVRGIVATGDETDLDLEQTSFMFEDEPGVTPTWSRAITAWVNTDPRAKMLLSRTARIHWANDAAYRMVREGDAFRAVEDILVSGNPATAAILMRLLQDASLDAARYAITPRDADRQWLLWAQQLIAGDDASIGFVAHRMAEPVSFEAMLQIHRLTPCETQIMKMMLAGLETGKIAQKQDISIETLRTHIKHAYRKLDVKSRGELFAKAIDFAGL